MLKIASCNCTSDLEIAVAMALSIEKSADTEVWGVSFLQADEILGYLAEEAISRVELFCCATVHVHILPGRHKPCWVIPLRHLRASSVQSGPSIVGFLPVSQKMEQVAVNGFNHQDVFKFLLFNWYRETVIISLKYMFNFFLVDFVAGACCARNAREALSPLIYQNIRRNYI